MVARIIKAVLWCASYIQTETCKRQTGEAVPEGEQMVPVVHYTCYMMRKGMTQITSEDQRTVTGSKDVSWLGHRWADCGIPMPSGSNQLAQHRSICMSHPTHHPPFFPFPTIALEIAITNWGTGKESGIRLWKIHSYFSLIKHLHDFLNLSWILMWMDWHDFKMTAKTWSLEN